MQTRNLKLETLNSFSRGFTLLEVLIALALLAILSGALYGTFFSLTRGRDAASNSMEGRRELRGTLDMLRRELSAAFYNRGNKRLHFVVEDRDVFGKPASTLAFTTVAPPRSDDLRSSDVVEVKYRAADRERRLTLTRQAKDVYLTGEALPYPQMEELEGFLVECFDGGKWVRSWDTTLNPGLPKAVKVTLIIKEGEKSVGFSTVATPRVASQ